MVKKLQKLADKKDAPAGGLLDSQLAQTVKDSAQQIWLAGLGAFAKAQGEGTKVFETLMKEGASLHRKTQAAAEEKIGDVAGRMSAMAGQVGDKANAHWDKLETIFEERTARALSKLGVPTAKDVAALTERVEALAAAVAALGGTPAVKTAARPASKRVGTGSRSRAAVAAEGAEAPKAAPRKRAAATAAQPAAKPAAKRTRKAPAA